MRPHTVAEAAAVVDAVARLAGRLPGACSAGAWCSPPTSTTCWPTGRSPPPPHYGDFPMHEDGIGMARAFEAELLGERPGGHRRRRRPTSAAGSSAPADAVDRPAPATGAHAAALELRRPTVSRLGRRRRVGLDRRRLRAVPGRAGTTTSSCASRPAATPRSAILTGPYGARSSAPLLDGLGRADVRVVAVENRFFGGNVGVTGLMVGEDLARVLAAEPEGHRYLLPDVCLTQGRFLDGTAPERPAPPGRGRAHRRRRPPAPAPAPDACGRAVAVAGPDGSRS